MNACRDLYLELMERCLIDYIYADVQKQTNMKTNHMITSRVVGHPLHPEVHYHMPDTYCEFCRTHGMDIPLYGHSMIGIHRLKNIRRCIEQVLQDGVPGDLMETGVWRGGAVIYMRAVLRAWEITDRLVWAADSFQGAPAPDEQDYPVDEGDHFHDEQDILAVPLERVKKNFMRYGLLDHQVCFLEGWFKDTLPHAPVERLAVLRLDGDMYGSTMESLTYLYPKLQVGGFLIVDDYGSLPACQEAVDDYRRAHEINEPILEIDRTGRYWRKENP